MFEVDFEALIHRPIEDVFERIIQIDDYPEWLPPSRLFQSCRQTSEGPVQAGTTFVDETPFGSFRGEVVRLAEPHEVIFHNHLSWLGLPVMESFPSYHLKERDEGTLVHHFGHGRCFGLFKVMAPRVARLAHVERKRTLNILKKSLENGA